MTVRLDEREPGFAAGFAALVDGRREEEVDVREAVTGIIADVRRDGDAALVALTHRFDRLKLGADELRFAPEEIDQRLRRL